MFLKKWPTFQGKSHMQRIWVMRLGVFKKNVDMGWIRKTKVCLGIYSKWGLQIKWSQKGAKGHGDRMVP